MVDVGDGKIGSAVIAQARDNSWWNKDPVVMKGIVAGGATSICIALGAFGIISEEQRTTIVEQVGNLTVAVFVIAPIVITTGTALWQRLSAWSPRSAARIAVLNAEAPAGSPPVLPAAP